MDGSFVDPVLMDEIKRSKEDPALRLSLDSAFDTVLKQYCFRDKTESEERDSYRFLQILSEAMSDVRALVLLSMVMRRLYGRYFVEHLRQFAQNTVLEGTPFALVSYDMRRGICLPDNRREIARSEEVLSYIQCCKVSRRCGLLSTLR